MAARATVCATNKDLMMIAAEMLAKLSMPVTPLRDPAGADSDVDPALPTRQVPQRLSGFICSPLDTPEGLGRGYFLSYAH